MVYEAWENSMNRQVALKVLPVGVAADSKALPGDVLLVKEARCRAIEISPAYVDVAMRLEIRLGQVAAVRDVAFFWRLSRRVRTI